MDCRFHGSSSLYTYKCDIPGIKEGDTVVVDGNRINVANVARVHHDIPLDKENITFMWVVGHVDMDTHKRRLDAEKALVRQVQDMRAKAIRQRVWNEMGISDEGQAQLRLSYNDAARDTVIDGDVAETLVDVDDFSEYDPDEYSDEFGGN